MNRTNNHTAAMSVAAVGVLLAAQSALAGVPLVELTIEVSDGFASTFNPPGTDNGDGTFNFAGTIIGAGWNIDFDFNTDPDPAGDGRVLIASGYTANNDTLDCLTFTLAATLPLDSSMADPSYDGSAAFGVTGFETLLSTTGPGSSWWVSGVDGSVVGSLFDDLTQIGTEFGSEGLSEFLTPGQLAAAANDSIFTTVEF